MAIQYHVDRWVEPSFRALLRPEVHLNQLSDQQIYYLEGFPYTHLVNTRCELDQIRLRLMWYEPPYHRHYLCTTPGKCETAWKFQWWGGIGKAFFNPDSPMTSNQLREELTQPGGLKIPGVCNDCSATSIGAILSGTHLSKEEDIIRAAVLRMSAFQTRRDDRDRLAKLSMQMTITEDGRMHPKTPAI